VDTSSDIFTSNVREETLETNDPGPYYSAAMESGIFSQIGKSVNLFLCLALFQIVANSLFSSNSEPNKCLIKFEIMKLVDNFI